MSAKRVALINMKGGVGKSTLAVNLAWQMSGVINRDNNVLVVDLDPQFNASQYLLGTDRYKRDVVDKNRPTIWDVFEEQTRVPGKKVAPINPADTIVTVKRWSSNRLDLLASRLELALSLKDPSNKHRSLQRFLERVDHLYDLILIDCAPTESVLTSAAYTAASHLLVPVKPEFLSTIGLPLLARSIKEHNSNPENSAVSVAGIVFNHTSDYLPEEQLSKEEVRRVAALYGWRIFDAAVPFSRSFPKGAREGRPLMTTSYARKDKKSQMFAFGNEFATAIGI